jgi:thiamine phosphate synthase YjbQ (UPF0047 family)
MKTLTEYLKFHTKTHRAYVDITSQVEQIVGNSGVQEGMVLISAMHITAGVYVNDNESGLIEDIDQWLEHLAPFRKGYNIMKPARITATPTSRRCSSTMK